MRDVPARSSTRSRAGGDMLASGRARPGAGLYTAALRELTYTVAAGAAAPARTGARVTTWARVARCPLEEYRAHEEYEVFTTSSVSHLIMEKCCTRFRLGILRKCRASVRRNDSATMAAPHAAGAARETQWMSFIIINEYFKLSNL
ncbi:hypothetical protein EVAR_80137_1 [Eumeta japonica]|uniref:Uncharacterized protein n=1 Tax=Eumeta variegata TaxID=151549 RepID=A0A4C1YGE0_EUMVA|nr:hypothetical protein EVAR_80137_1 [Eumeta japonica]